MGGDAGGGRGGGVLHLPWRGPSVAAFCPVAAHDAAHLLPLDRGWRACYTTGNSTERVARMCIFDALQAKAVARDAKKAPLSWPG